MEEEGLLSRSPPPKCNDVKVRYIVPALASTSEVAEVASEQSLLMATWGRVLEYPLAVVTLPDYLVREVGKPGVRGRGASLGGDPGLQQNFASSQTNRNRVCKTIS